MKLYYFVVPLNLIAMAICAFKGQTPLVLLNGFLVISQILINWDDIRGIK